MKQFTKSGTIDINGTLITCYGTNDGIRIVSLGGLHSVCGYSSSSNNTDYVKRVLDRVDKQTNGRLGPTINKYHKHIHYNDVRIADLIEQLQNPIVLASRYSQARVSGLLPMSTIQVIGVIAEAYNRGLLHPQQEHIGEHCNNNLFYLAQHSIDSLVSEVLDKGQVIPIDAFRKKE